MARDYEPEKKCLHQWVLKGEGRYKLKGKKALQWRRRFVCSKCHEETYAQENEKRTEGMIKK
jgi:hypothetical protein